MAAGVSGYDHNDAPCDGLEQLLLRAGFPAFGATESWLVQGGRAPLASAAGEPEPEISSMRVKELLEELRGRGVSTDGMYEKKDLVEALTVRSARLLAFDATSLSFEPKLGRA